MHEENNEDKDFENALIDAISDADIYVSPETWEKHRFIWIALSACGVKINLKSKEKKE